MRPTDFTTLRMAGRALQHRNYRLFFIGQAISVIGTWMQAMAQGWLVYRLSGSPLALGEVGFATQFPAFLITVLAGVAADRLDKRKIVLVTQSAALLQALALSALTFGKIIEVWHVIALAAFFGIAQSFDIPARQAMAAELVPREDLPNAIALNSTLFNLGRLAGPALGGIVVAWLGEDWCFFLNALSYLAVVVSLLLMHVPHSSRRKAASPLRDLGEGLRYAMRTPPFRAIYTMLGAISIFGMSYSTLMPVFAGAVLKGDARLLGWLMSAAGAGALIGALRLALRESPLGLEYWPSRGAFVFGISLAVVGASSQIWVVLACLFCAGHFMLSAVVAANTLAQSHVPDALRGRIMSFHAFSVMGLGPFGALGAGLAAHLLGTRLTLCAMGILLAMVAAIVHITSAISAYPPPLVERMREGIDSP